ncbi:hypothetical protein [Roseateles sp.]|uniref:hypothetical protein n=1 Tax=Roseateles sp. TaxID=1971397 RepID=UPI003267D20D
MTPFSNFRTRRITAFLALLVWAFALTFGMANACLLETANKHVHGAQCHVFTAHHAHAIDSMEALAGAVAQDHDDEADATKESCLKACEDGSNVPIKLQAGVDLTDLGLAAFVVFAWNAATPFASAPSRFDERQVAVAGLPFRLRYSRLTL